MLPRRQEGPQVTLRGGRRASAEVDAHVLPSAEQGARSCAELVQGPLQSEVCQPEAGGELERQVQRGRADQRGTVEVEVDQGSRGGIPTLVGHVRRHQRRLAHSPGPDEHEAGHPRTVHRQHGRAIREQCLVLLLTADEARRHHGKESPGLLVPRDLATYLALQVTGVGPDGGQTLQEASRPEHAVEVDLATRRVGHAVGRDQQAQVRAAEPLAQVAREGVVGCGFDRVEEAREVGQRPWSGEQVAVPRAAWPSAGSRCQPPRPRRRPRRARRSRPPARRRGASPRRAGRRGRSGSPARR